MALDKKLVDEGDKTESPMERDDSKDSKDTIDIENHRVYDDNGKEAVETSTDGDQGQAKDDSNDSGLPFSKARCIALVATLTGAAFLNPELQTLALQSVVIILPTISRDLSVPETRQQWIISSYSLVFGCFLLFWGRVADLYGKRLVFICGSIWVTAITAANPFMPNDIAFILFRGLHGLGAAATVPTAIGILGVTFPPSKAKNYAFSTYGAGAPLGSVFGNIVSGCIAEYSNWKWVFGAVAIMAAATAVAGIFVIPPPPPSAPLRDGTPSIDWIGAVLITTGLLALMFALTQGNVVGWTVPWIPVLIVLSILIIAAFGFWQWHLERRLTAAKADEAPCSPSSLTPPLVKVSIFSNLRFTAVMLIMGLFFAAFSNYLIFATYYFQDFQGLSPLQTMLRFLPTGFGGAIVVYVVSQLISRVPTLFILISGNVAISIACLLYAVPIPPSTSYFAWGLPAMLLSVIGADTTWPCLTLFTSHALPREDQAIGGALINCAGQFGRSIGLAISTAVQTAVMANARHVPITDVGGLLPFDAPSLKGLRVASWVNFAFGMAALAIVLVAFRSLEIVGKAGHAAPPSPKTGGEEALVINNGNINDDGNGKTQEADVRR